MNNKNFMQEATDLNENGEWVEVPLENVMPKWLYESLAEEDEDAEIALTLPYLENEFRQWLISERDLSERSADNYINAYMSAYESLYDKVELDLYHLLHSFLVEIPEKTKCDLTKEAAPGLVEIYVDAILKELGKNEDTYTKTEFLAFTTYHAFIVEVAESSDKTFVKEKSSPLPDEDEFLSWLETECKIDYENARKIVSSVKRMDLILPSLVTEPMTFLDVLRALPVTSKRKNYLNLVRTKKRAIFHKTGISEKTISNGLANVNLYIIFLKNKINKV